MADGDRQQMTATVMLELCSTLIQLLIDRQLIDALEIAQRIRPAADRLADSGLPDGAAAATHLHALAETLAAARPIQ